MPFSLSVIVELYYLTNSFLVSTTPLAYTRRMMHTPLTGTLDVTPSGVMYVVEITSPAGSSTTMSLIDVVFVTGIIFHCVELAE